MKYQKPVHNYVESLLGDRDSFLSDELPLENDEDYIMTIRIVIEYEENTSPYTVEFLEGGVEKNGYTIPLYRIQRK